MMCSMARPAPKRSGTASTGATPYRPCSALPGESGMFAAYHTPAAEHHGLPTVSDSRTAVEFILDGMLPSTSSWRSRRLEQRANNSNKFKVDPLTVEPSPEQCVVGDPYASALLRLPPEIRIAILEYLIPPPPKVFKIYTDCDPAMASKRWDRHRDPRPRKASLSSFTSKQQRQRYRIPCPLLPSRNARDSLAILRTTRLIYYESLPMLYSQTTFHFIGSNFLPILDFFRGLSPIARERVRQIKVTMLADGRDLKRTHLDMFSNVMQELIPSLNFLDLSPIAMSPALETGDIGLGYLK